MHIATFDLGEGQHARVDSLLSATLQSLLRNEKELQELAEQCSYTLWVRYQFEPGEAAFNLSESLMANFALLHVELVFQLGVRETGSGV